MIKSVIIDDKETYRERLRELIESDFAGRIQVLAEADDVPGGLEIIYKHQPDLVFLDIEMPGGTGFDLLEKIGTVKFDVIFMTVHQDYALRAIKFSALDYLLKPIDREELQNAVKKALQTLERPKSQQIEVLPLRFTYKKSVSSKRK